MCDIPSTIAILIELRRPLADSGVPNCSVVQVAPPLDNDSEQIVVYSCLQSAVPGIQFKLLFN